MTDFRLEPDSIAQLLAEVQEALRAGHFDRAGSLLPRQALDSMLDGLNPHGWNKELLFELADVLSKAGREEHALRCYHKMLETNVDPVVCNKLGSLYLSLGRLSQGVHYQQMALEQRPDSPELLANLARATMEAGEVEKGIGLLREAVARMPDNAQAHSNLLFRMHHREHLDPQALFEEHKRWAKLHAPAELARREHANPPDPNRRLRIGYISPDFRRHSVAYFFEPLLDGHDRNGVGVYGYGNVEFPDEITDRLRHKFDGYRDVFAVNDAQVASMIEADQIDILVDLAGHVGDNRLLVMARKPAPVQVTYLGYPDTTGVAAVGYRLTDAWAESADAQQFYCEELFPLCDGFLCYGPPDYAPSVEPAPAEANGFVTFGSFNNSCKLNPFIIGLWATLLETASDAKLLLKIKAGQEPEIADRYLKQFAQKGVDPNRVRICGWRPPLEHFETYSEVDIALDTFPYNGTTTTCEALWMGVPTISLVGRCHASRVGLSILSRLGLEFFAAATAEEYVAKAAALASSVSALSRMRRAMRARIAVSGLCHARAFARSVEAAYRTMWKRWCDGRASGRVAASANAATPGSP